MFRSDYRKKHVDVAPKLYVKCNITLTKDVKCFQHHVNGKCKNFCMVVVSPVFTED